MPQLSIITVNLNNLAGLQKTMQSVFEQSFTDYEYIIIDGGSTDGSREYIEQHKEKLAYWVSEKDGGIFNAMNKGIDQSSGEYLIFMNSGDYFYSTDVLTNVFKENPKADIVYGNVKWWPVNHNGNYPDHLSFNHFKHNTIPHQGSFIRKELFNLVGKYDEQYEVNSDWNFFVLAIFKYNCSYKHLNLMISYCNTDGVSLTNAGFEQTTEIRNQFIKEHFSAFNEDFEKMDEILNQNKYFKNLLKQRIMKYAFRLNKQYQRFRKSLRSK
ncbi:MAG: glycosyltransferase [Chitinophagaceae bacterium]|nr:glycosyltransferase [Chitinophagaceae bacterium]